MGVDLSRFQNAVDQWERERPNYERKLYDAACKGDTVAAVELQYWQAEFGALKASDIEYALREGQREADLKRLRMTTMPNQRHGTEWHSLQAFGVSKRKTNPGHATTAKLLKLRHAFGFMLTSNDLRIALTTEFAKRTKKDKKPKLGRKDWAESVGEIEYQLIGYVSHLFKGTKEDDARAYVRDSFPGIPWDQPDETAEYPLDW